MVSSDGPSPCRAVTHCTSRTRPAPDDVLLVDTFGELGRLYALARLMHAQEPAASVASGLLAIIIPANIPMGLGMALSGVLRAAG